MIIIMIWEKLFKNGPSKICQRQTAFKKFEGIWLSSTIFTSPFLNALSHIQVYKKV